MARPKEFDRHEAVERAKAVFWARGYEGASTPELLRAMGIGRQSMYDTFGGKRRLYLEALRSYMDENVSRHVGVLRSAASPLAGVEATRVALASGDAAERALGCMGVGAISEFGQSDADVAAMTAASGALLEGALAGAIHAAKAAGEVDAALDERRAARFLHSTMLGMKVSAKAGLGADDLRDLAVFAVDRLRAW
jgi:AcrR family transcriptional regulator